ncbi:PDR/VanB family oxidoreductase [Actinomadura macrotermitis]|uniref:Phthalate dioxygenase reductase n=1 Tax=Actinomadura macrotermitis TaxID=2585200 RepID=A0A7K0BPN0_9ACTN|nr:Phthalate dioxygenase reductase [Actinomadura macrotermitis]
MTIPPDLRGRRARDPFWVATSALLNGMMRVRALRPRELPPVRPVDRRLALVVQEVRREAEDVVSLRLGAPDGGVLPAWQPGSHLDVHLPSGRRRQYSLCGDPADRRTYRIAVRRLADGAGGSREVHEALTEGARITVEEPRNAFPFLARDAYLFIAGGIGITPILPMVREAERLGADWRLVYTGRTRASLAFLDELPAGRVTVRTDDEHGVPDCAAILADAPAGAAIYCCGPAPMIDGVRAAFTPGGPATLHYERFAPAPIADGRPFEVELKRSGTTLAVPADRSILDVVKEQVPSVAYSCRQGFCGTCRVGLAAGDADRRHPNDAAPGSLLICVSRASGGKLTLDL